MFLDFSNMFRDFLPIILEQIVSELICQDLIILADESVENYV